MRTSVEQFIIDAKNYNFSPFKDNRGECGFSGQLLVATHKKTGKKLLVKHTYPYDVPNEFTAGFLAEHMGIGNPKYYLFKKSNKFSCGYAVGIEYMDGLGAIDNSNLTELQATDFIAQVALNALIFQEDKTQLNFWKDRVVSYDFAKSFNVDSYHFDEDAPIEDTTQGIDRFQNCILFSPDSALRMMGWPEERLPWVNQIYDNWLSTLLNVDTDLLYDILSQILPNPVVCYYYGCVLVILNEITDWLADPDDGKYF